jgi:hypothetical protein
LRILSEIHIFCFPIRLQSQLFIYRALELQSFSAIVLVIAFGMSIGLGFQEQILKLLDFNILDVFANVFNLYFAKHLIFLVRFYNCFLEI